MNNFINNSYKRQQKIHLKITSVFVVCCKFLLTLFNKVKYRDKQCRPRSDCSFQQTTKAANFCCDRRFNGLTFMLVHRTKKLLVRSNSVRSDISNKVWVYSVCKSIQRRLYEVKGSATFELCLLAADFVVC